MIKITKEQRDFLISKNAKYGLDIHRTGNHHNRAYYLTVSRKMLELLYEFETSRVNK